MRGHGLFLLFFFCFFFLIIGCRLPQVDCSFERMAEGRNIKNQRNEQKRNVSMPGGNGMNIVDRQGRLKNCRMIRRSSQVVDGDSTSGIV